MLASLGLKTTDALNLNFYQFVCIQHVSSFEIRKLRIFEIFTHAHNTVIHLQFWAYGSWDSLFPISISPNCKLMSPKHFF